jgi:small subunit ribosomal protein S13
MARIAGHELNDKDRVVYSLTTIKGIGMSLSTKIMSAAGLPLEKRVHELTPGDISKITEAIEKISIEGDLLRQVRSNISRLQQIGSFRGLRHSRNLPARGQRTRHNARTKRGKRKTIGAFKKDLLAKTQKDQKE